MVAVGDSQPITNGLIRCRWHFAVVVVSIRVGMVVVVMRIVVIVAVGMAVTSVMGGGAM